MMNYVAFFSLYVVLGFATFGAFRWWYAFLIRLAEKHDVPTRRKIATRWYLLFALLLLLGLWSIIICSVALIHRLSALIPAVLITALLPSFIWWFRRLNTLTELGYGRQRSRG